MKFQTSNIHKKQKKTLYDFYAKTTPEIQRENAQQTKPATSSSTLQRAEVNAKRKKKKQYLHLSKQWAGPFYGLAVRQAA